MKALGHLKHKNSISNLSLIVTLDHMSTLDCILLLTNPSKYDPAAKNFEGPYNGRLYVNLEDTVRIINPKMLRDYGLFEEMIHNAINTHAYMSGLIELDLKRK
jgi:hypothetical protein